MVPPWKSVRHPHLFEVNTRVLLTTMRADGRRATLDDIPVAYWQSLADRGIHWVWLMGVWSLVEKQHTPDLIPEAMMHEFRALLPDLSDADIDGSPYAIDAYEVDDRLGGNAALRRTREKINDLGMGLMLDFIPNHFGAHTRWLQTHPEYFLEVPAESAADGSNTFFVPDGLGDRYFAHGKDPYFAAWQDTIQVDYSKSETRAFMTEQLVSLATLCDGVRCDMAMLAVPQVFSHTWGHFRTWEGTPFWPGAIQRARDVNRTFTLLGEVYWDMESEMLENGFDYCYDKTFYDRLTDPAGLHAHFNAEPSYLLKTARFLENHDEQRANARLTPEQHLAAATLIGLGPGMRFWHMGEWEGWKNKIPVQLNRGPEDRCHCTVCVSDPLPRGCRRIARMYEALFRVFNMEILMHGTWSVVPAEGLFVWQWDGEESLRVVINYSPEKKQLPADMVPDEMERIKTGFDTNGSMLKPWAVHVYRSRKMVK